MIVASEGSTIPDFWWNSVQVRKVVSSARRVHHRSVNRLRRIQTGDSYYVGDDLFQSSSGMFSVNHIDVSTFHSRTRADGEHVRFFFWRRHPHPSRAVRRLCFVRVPNVSGDRRRDTAEPY